MSYTGLAFCYGTILNAGGDKPFAVIHFPASSYPNKMLALYNHCVPSVNTLQNNLI
jgi:hypothetical protein